MYVFIDEAGNTGGNLFDFAQPDFLTGALITKIDFDVRRSEAVRSLCRQQGISSIHGSVIGTDAVENVAEPLLRILKDVDARFFISRVEKTYLLGTKVFDTFFDSGENAAVPQTAYNVKPLRLLLCLKVAALIDEALARSFWTMLMARSEEAAQEMVPGICNAFLERVGHLPDLRSRELVSDAFTWARDHPEAFEFTLVRRQAKQGHMPNLVAFANLLRGLEEYSRRWKRPVRRITHDRQSQFERMLHEYHRLYEEAKGMPINWFGGSMELRMVPRSEFRVSSSEESAGIQVADLLLWLFGQMVKGNPLPKASVRFLSYGLKRAYINDFSFDGVSRQLVTELEAIADHDLTPEELARGRMLVEEGERHRRLLMEQYEIDGQTPYQRGVPDRHLVVGLMLDRGGKGDQD